MTGPVPFSIGSHSLDLWSQAVGQPGHICLWFSLPSRVWSMEAMVFGSHGTQPSTPIGNEFLKGDSGLPGTLGLPEGNGGPVAQVQAQQAGTRVFTAIVTRKWMEGPLSILFSVLSTSNLQIFF